VIYVKHRFPTRQDHVKKNFNGYLAMKCRSPDCSFVLSATQRSSKLDEIEVVNSTPHTCAEPDSKRSTRPSYDRKYIRNAVIKELKAGANTKCQLSDVKAVLDKLGVAGQLSRATIYRIVKDVNEASRSDDSRSKGGSLSLLLDAASHENYEQNNKDLKPVPAPNTSSRRALPGARPDTKLGAKAERKGVATVANAAKPRTIPEVGIVAADENTDDDDDDDDDDDRMAVDGQRASSKASKRAPSPREVEMAEGSARSEPNQNRPTARPSDTRALGGDSAEPWKTLPDAAGSENLLLESQEISISQVAPNTVNEGIDDIESGMELRLQSMGAFQQTDAMSSLKVKLSDFASEQDGPSQCGPSQCGPSQDGMPLLGNQGEERLYEPINVLVDQMPVDQISVALENPDSGGQAVFERTMELAQAGDAESQYTLGGFYEHGLYVSCDAEEGVYWYRSAAEKGHVKAQHNLGCCYFNGFGVREDASKAVHWFKKAANCGDPNAQRNLAICYTEGYGVEADLKVAFSWYMAAAQAGNVDAQVSVAACYRDGIGVQRDQQSAAHWLKKSKTSEASIRDEQDATHNSDSSRIQR